MNLLISHFFSQKNKGDAAILSAMLSEVKKKYPDSKITVTTTEPIDSEEYYEEARLVQSFFYFAVYSSRNPAVKVIKTFYVAVFTLLWAMIWKMSKIPANFLLSSGLKKVLRAYVEADMVLLVGGGYITGKNSMQGTMTVLLHLHAVAIGLLLKKPTFLFSQSIGPFGNRFQEIASGWVLNKVNLIFAREDYSLETLKNIGVRGSIVRRSVDAAFLFKSDQGSLMKIYLADHGVNANNELLGITVKRFLEKDAQAKYEEEIAGFIDSVVASGINVVMVPQVTSKLHNDDDRDVGRRVHQMLKNKSGCLFVDDDLDHYQVKGLYENMRWFVGTRMHSCIFSLTAYVPVIAIEYEYKTGGIMKDLGLQNWVIKMRDVTAGRLTQMFEQLQGGREKYLDTLENNLPPYQRDASDVIEEISKNYQLRT